MVIIVPQSPAQTPSVAAPHPDPVEQPLPKGRVVLDVQPDSAEIFVDGYYMGTPDDLKTGRGNLVLDTGPHSIELRAFGYESEIVEVRIRPDETITYRRALKPIEAPPAVPPSGPATFYLIPGCYMGNVPPTDAALPAACDVTQTLTFRN